MKNDRKAKYLEKAKMLKNIYIKKKGECDRFSDLLINSRKRLLNKIQNLLKILQAFYRKKLIGIS